MIGLASTPPPASESQGNGIRVHLQLDAERLSDSFFVAELHLVGYQGQLAMNPRFGLLENREIKTPLRLTCERVHFQM